MCHSVVWPLISKASGASSQFWPVAECQPAPKAGEFAPATPQASAPMALAGLAVTEDHYLLVGTLQPAGLLVFDLFGGGAQGQRLDPEAGTAVSASSVPVMSVAAEAAPTNC